MVSTNDLYFELLFKNSNSKPLDENSPLTSGRLIAEKNCLYLIISWFHVSSEYSFFFFTVKQIITQHFNYRWRYFVTAVNWVIDHICLMSRFFILWPVKLKQTYRKCLFLNHHSRNLQFVSGTWSGDSDLVFVRQSPGKEHLQPSTETDSVSQAISLNRSSWMNAFVPYSLPVIVSYCRVVTVNVSSQHFLPCHIDWCGAVD